MAPGGGTGLTPPKPLNEIRSVQYEDAVNANASAATKTVTMEQMSNHIMEGSSGAVDLGAMGDGLANKSYFEGERNSMMAGEKSVNKDRLAALEKA